jgi:hypothetical protein
MARVLAGDISKIVGKVGDKVYVKYKNGIYVRKAPTVRKNARTPAMLLNQQRFGCITRYCIQFKNSLISMIWNDAATTGSGYNLFLKENSPAFAKDGSIADPLLLKFSTGKLTMPDHFTAQRLSIDLDIIDVLWEKETHIFGTRQKDDLAFICYDGAAFSSMLGTGIRRRDAGGSFSLPVMKQKVQYIYLFFASEDRRSFSESQGVKI